MLAGSTDAALAPPTFWKTLGVLASLASGRQWVTKANLKPTEASTASHERVSPHSELQMPAQCGTGSAHGGSN